MLTTLLILTTILLALAGLAIMKLSNAYTALNAEYVELLEEAAQDSVKLDSLLEEYSEYKFDAYIREQTLRNALEDAETVADDNEWLYQDSEKCYAEAVAALEELQEVHKSYVEGTSEFTANQAREIAQLNQVIENLQDDIIRLEAERVGMARFRIGLDKQIRRLKADLAVSKELQERQGNDLNSRNQTIIALNQKVEEMTAHIAQKQQSELEAYYKAEADLTEAIEAAEEAPIHMDEKKAWICIGEWARLIVYKHNPYQPYVQHGLGGKIERTKRKDLTTKAQEKYNALKAALKSL